MLVVPITRRGIDTRSRVNQSRPVVEASCPDPGHHMSSSLVAVRVVEVFGALSHLENHGRTETECVAIRSDLGCINFTYVGGASGLVFRA